MSHLCVPLWPLLKEDKVEAVSQQQDEEEEKEEKEEEEEEAAAPDEPHSYQEEEACSQPGDGLLEQADHLTEPQALGFQQAQAPEVLNGGSHPGEHSPSQKGVCGFYRVLFAALYSLCACTASMSHCTSFLSESVSERMSFTRYPFFLFCFACSSFNGYSIFSSLES